MGKMTKTLTRTISPGEALVVEVGGGFVCITSRTRVTVKITVFPPKDPVITHLEVDRRRGGSKNKAR